MSAKCNVLILGASYGSLLASKLLLAGHTVKLVCLPAESELINREGIRVRLPINALDPLVEIDSRGAPGTLSADGPKAVGLVSFENQGRPTEIKLDLVRTGMGWRISDIKWPSGTLSELYKK